MATGTVETLIAETGALLTPLKGALRTKQDARILLALLGWDLPPGVDETGLVNIDVKPVLNKLAIVVGSTPSERMDLGVMAGRFKDLGVAVVDLMEKLSDLAAALQNTLVGAGDYLQKTKIDQQLVPRLLDFLIAYHICRRSPPLYHALVFLGVIRLQPRQANPTNYEVEHVRVTIEYDRIPTLFSDPQQVFAGVYGWGTANFDSVALLTNLAGLFASFGASAQMRPLPRWVEERLLNRQVPEADVDPVPQLMTTIVRGLGFDPLEFGISFFRLRPTAAQATNAGLGAFPYLVGIAQTEFEISETLLARIASTVDLQGGVAMFLRPGTAPWLESGFAATGNPAALGSGSIAVRLSHMPPNNAPLLLIPGGSRLEAREVYAGIGGEIDVGGTPDVFVEVGIRGGRLILTAGEMDNFLRMLLPASGIETEFDLGLEWSRRRGLHLDASGTLETALPLHLTLGVFRLETLHIALAASTAGLKTEISLSGTGSFGPITVTAERIGVGLVFDFKTGNAGIAGIILTFKPPTGLGLLVDAGPITGGGFISFDGAKGRYAGILHLRLAEISITAIGLLDTKVPLPDGRTGFSFLIIITGKFPPIQLGFGFTLNGIGGLAGIHRTIVTEAIQAGIRSHSVDHILFPEDPLRDAVQIISDLTTIFPPAHGHYVFGPMAIIGYGTPTLIEAELGILLELPDPIRLVILGQLHAHLPTKQEAVVELHLDVVGVIEFSKKTLAIDAVLHDSRLAVFDLYGDMALRLAWGEQPTFALSIGGFHPAFQPPPGFPALRRLTLALGDGGNPRFTMQMYLAMTSNTLQFGVLGELYAEAAGFNISGWLGFDVLVIVSPFSLLADLDAGVVLRRQTTLLASVTLRASLTGPTPWHLWGRATLDAIIDITVPFDHMIGPDVEEVLPDTDPWPLLEKALKDARNWSATLPPAGFTAVSLAIPSGAAPAAGPLLDPLGSATVRERVVPLNRTITKFGEAKPVGPSRYAVKELSVGGVAVSAPAILQDYFAPAQFEEMGDAEKLSRPSFEKMDAGFALATNAVDVGVAVGTDVVFNTIIVDQPDARYHIVDVDTLNPEFAALAAPTSKGAADQALDAYLQTHPERKGKLQVVLVQYRMSEGHQRSVLDRSASAQAPLASMGAEKFAPPPTVQPVVGLKDEGYQIVYADTLVVESAALAQPRTKGAAYQALAEYLRANPAKKGQLQVVPEHEVVA